MKTCPACRESFGDDNLNFCLNCGNILTGGAAAADNPPPTVMMDGSRRTNPYFDETQGNFGSVPPPATYQPPSMSAPPAFGTSAPIQGADQTLPTVSLVLGVCSFLLFCCYAGLPLGAGALITGYIGLKNIEKDPQRYGGKGLATGGLVLGALSLVGSIIWILFVLIASIAG